MTTVKPWILLAFVAACSSSAGSGGTTGAETYQNVCATCHGPNGTPTASMVARLNVKDLRSKELRDRITPALVEQQVRKGSQNKLMPAFEGALSEDQIKAVSAYIASPEFLNQ